MISPRRILFDGIARTSREHDQVGRLQPAHARIERVDAGRDARKPALALEGGAGHVERDVDRRTEIGKPAIISPGLGQFVEPALRVLDLLLRRHVDRRVIGDVDHVLADGDELPAAVEVIDRAAVILRVDDGRGFRR